MQESLLEALSLTICRYDVWLIVLAAAIYGTFVGAIPGLTATMAVALFVPMTYWLEPIPALAAIVSMVACAIFAGDIPTALLRIPGTPASAAYVEQTYRLAQKGLVDRALGMGLWASVIGGLIGAVVLMIAGDQLARIATMFSVAEYFWLYLLGLSCPILVSSDSRLRAAFALLVGLALSTVGLGAVHSEARFTFGFPQLYQGIGFIPAMIGLFGLSEVCSSLARLRAEPEGPGPSVQRTAGPSRRRGFLSYAWTEMLAPSIHRYWRRKGALLRSGTVGSAIGMLPGAGVDIASWVSVALSDKNAPPIDDNDSTLTAQDEEDLNAISDASTANSSALAGCWIPSLVFGIPGDSVTAIVIGVLLMKNIEPGPAIFEKQAPLVYGIYLLFILANLMLLPIGLLAIRLGGYIVHIPKNVLLPLIILFCVVGAYAINGSLFDVWVMLVMGLVGFLFDRRRIPLGPIVLGMILGGPLEERFIQTISGANGSLVGLIERPAAAVLGGITLLAWVWALSSAFIRNRRQNHPTQTGGEPA